MLGGLTQRLGAGARLLRAPAARLQQRGWASDTKEELEEEAASWFKEFAKSKANVVVAGTLALLGINLVGNAAADYYYQRQVVSTLVRGVVPKVGAPAPLPREPVRQQIISVLQPKEPTRFYHILTGSPGTGKTTLVREACAATGGGVGYVDVSPAFEVDFGSDLGSAFNFRFEEHLTLFNIVSQTVLGAKVRDKGEEHPLSSLRRSAEALYRAASAYRERTGRPFVLALDSVDRLAKEEGSRQALGALLEYAREWAQEGVITCVFVTSDWATVGQLRGTQPGSRASPPIHIGHVTQEEALQYLQSLGVAGRMAQDCVGLVGGALLLLERCAGMAKAGMAFPDVKNSLLRMIEHGYEAVGLLDSTPQQEPGLQVVEALLQSRSHAIPSSQWRSMMPDRELQSKLLKGGVLKLHHGPHYGGEELTFESRLAYTYARERLRSRLAPEQKEKHKGLGGRSPMGGWWLWWW